ncbi:MAG: NHL repeat-containing protein [candidate division Zixibacteria bacterium]|nr:NHL repeat-containing protein [candidate division Zixibacteria bacterium]
MSMGGADAIGQVSPWFVKAIYYEPLGSAGFRSISGMASDPVSGELYVLDAGRHAVDVIDSAGFPRFTFNHWVTDLKTGQKAAGEPNSIAITPEGDIYLTDFFSRRVDILNIRGDVIEHIDMLAEVGWDGVSLRPEKLGIDKLGWLYVSIGGERSGVLRRRLAGGRAEVFIDAASEKIDCITGMAVAADGRVAILDYRGVPAVRIYSPDGKLLLGFGDHEIAGGDLSFPVSMLFAEDGTYWVADGLRQAVKHYASDGKFLEFIGGFGGAPGNLRFPSALAGDGVAHLVVAERVGRRVQQYVLPGALAANELKSLRPASASPIPQGLESPASSAVASEPQTEK